MRGDVCSLCNAERAVIDGLCARCSGDDLRKDITTTSRPQHSASSFNLVRAWKTQQAREKQIQKKRIEQEFRGTIDEVGRIEAKKKREHDLVDQMHLSDEQRRLYHDMVNIKFEKEMDKVRQKIHAQPKPAARDTVFDAVVANALRSPPPRPQQSQQKRSGLGEALHFIDDLKQQAPVFKLNASGDIIGALGSKTKRGLKK